MRTADADILLVPGKGDAGPDHWLSRWEAKLPTARRVVQEEWQNPDLEAWSGRIAAAVGEATRPVILVAHGLGVLAVVHAGARLEGKVAGAFLVTPPAPARLRAAAGAEAGFAGMAHTPLPFPAVLVASRDDPAADYADLEALAAAWGVTLADAGAAGGIDAASGHGPWPEGLMRFAGFLKGL